MVSNTDSKKNKYEVIEDYDLTKDYPDNALIVFELDKADDFLQILDKNGKDK